MHSSIFLAIERSSLFGFQYLKTILLVYYKFEYDDKTMVRVSSETL